ncbi:uncharacterized protein M6B38_274580 [Iris pallida]|uniref:Uncharacterized protein n=1 Tax=Iris pallida TaxID=29817 RepID=A0AAX6I5X5_IRIPA|nr:uncharacterized protein M6B38_274580 [Iris pallida]
MQTWRLGGFRHMDLRRCMRVDGGGGEAVLGGDEPAKRRDCGLGRVRREHKGPRQGHLPRVHKSTTPWRRRSAMWRWGSRT